MYTRKEMGTNTALLLAMKENITMPMADYWEPTAN